MHRVSQITSSAASKTNPHSLLLAASLAAGLYLSSLYSYLLFHTLAELFSIVIAWMVFVLAWNSRRFLEGGYLLFLGISLLFVGFIDLVHTLAFKGMGIFQGYDANLPTQLWIAARYMQSLALLAAPLWIRRPLRTGWTLAGFALLTAVLLVLIFAGYFPACYIEGTGLTPFKRVSEYVINGILAAAIVLLFRDRGAFNPRLFRFLILAILASIVSELAFTLYVSVSDLLNFTGHLFKILAFYFIYKAIIETGFTQPFELLFHDLHQREAALQASHQELELANRRLHEAVTQAEQRADELEMVLAELHTAQDALKEYTVKLEASNRELEDFASVASHDLQEPLRKIAFFGDRLQEGLSGRMDDAECTYLERMLDAARRMQGMIDALLTYARVTTKAQPYAPVDLQAVVGEVISDLEARLDQTSGRIEVGDLAVIEADPLQMRQLFQNLIGNALKFYRQGAPPLVRVWSRPQMGDRGEQTMDGRRQTADHGPQLVDGEALDIPGGRLSAVGGQPYIVQDFELTNQIEILIEDNGIGFDPQYLDRIFKPFERLNGRSEFEGAGMGLAICQKIVERHHGSITARSIPGQGSTFIISLPIKQAASNS